MRKIACIVAFLLVTWGHAHATTPVVVNYLTGNFSWQWQQGAGTAVAQFRMKCGATAGGPYTIIQSYPDPTKRSVPLASVFSAPGTYYCVVVAVDSAGVESKPTNEVGLIARTAASVTQDIVSACNDVLAGTTLPAGLVTAFRFSEGSGGTTADVSESGNTGVISGATWVAGKYGQALAFNGTNNFVAANTRNLPAANMPQTISWWMVVKTNPTNVQTIISLANAAAASAVQPGFQGSRIGVWKSGGTWLVSATPPPPNVWHYYAYTFDGTTHRLYLDGTQVGTSTVAPQAALPTTLDLGRWAGNSEFFAGSLDEVRIYNRALSVSEIQTDMVTTGSVNALQVTGAP